MNAKQQDHASNNVISNGAARKKNGGNDVIFYNVSRNSNKQVNYVFQQVIFCAAAYFFTPFLRKYSVLHWITFIGKKHLHYIYDLRSGKSQYVANLSIDW